MAADQPLHDEEYVLWQRFKSGDQEAFALLYEQYVGILYNYGYHITPHTALVQDAIQDLFTDLWRTRQNLSDTTSVKYYLFRSLRRKIHRLSETYQTLQSIPESDNLPDIPHILSQEALRIEKDTQEELIRQLQQALTNLPERQQEAIRLRFFDGFELREVASIMQMNEQSVRNLIQRSIKKLRQAFELLPVLMFCHQFI
ncbi:sigma-70 family RNA polymerase sigma factor [Rhabdobacter roseus]|uniref:RNA polymerase sigma-70 factor (ECF subfamily) n=1 Tax=Rhabdobacter roseus TaxID=1655419 RepID=A0A840U3L2_9BACT|nr:sigma-70 family RNA polymerase sigma factor [Rhabdobacter roseus]MBB5286429.1 RNA polymerase sigma-70 factor (ECF subfamily) [Rhabdobacter roseus]